MRLRLVALVLCATSAHAVASLSYFLQEVALIKPPPKLDDALRLLTDRGETTLRPLPQDLAAHPLLIPLTERADGAVTGLLRSPERSTLELVRTSPDSLQLEWLANSAELFVARQAEMDAFDADVASDGADAVPRSGTASLAGRIILRVGPFMGEYESLVNGHLASGATQSALIACERNQGCFGDWGRPFAFHARILSNLGRDEEARDVARHALTNPLCTLNDKLGAICALSNSCTGQLVERLEWRSKGKLTEDELRRSNGMDTRTPQEIALVRAACLLDLCVAAPSHYSYAAIRPQLGELYGEAGLSSLGALVNPDETI